MNASAYLRRINYVGPTTPSAETLRGLQLAHLLAVPFENLDIALRRPIVLDETRLFSKIVDRRRGGFCYELNSLFAALLRELGFKVTMLSGRARRQLEFDHLALRVEVPGAPESWLADVGFGEAFLEPLRLQEGMEQRQASGTYRLSRMGERWSCSQLTPEGWKELYNFALTPRVLSEFTEMCHYHQTSPESQFTQRRVCSLPLPDGRVTLAGMRLILTRNGNREERLLQSEAEYQAALREQFGIVL
jgi:N-hydroxyarylamine O-acetyltransferase